MAVLLGTAACSSRAASANLTARARLSARIASPIHDIEPGQHELALAASRNGILYVPRSYRRERPAPFILLLHGAGGSAGNWFGSYGARAESLGAIMLAPESRGPTWDAIRGDFGADVSFVDMALRYTFERCAIDRRRVAIAGFSDGATYALSLGLPNGDLFTHVIAFSPGFIREDNPVGNPPLFVSHGVRDTILPIEATSRAIVPHLRAQGYTVEYVEFAGGHSVPAEIATQGLSWFLTT